MTPILINRINIFELTNALT